MKMLNAFSWSSSVETATLFVVMPLLGMFIFVLLVLKKIFNQPGFTLDSIKGGRFGRR